MYVRGMPESRTSDKTNSRTNYRWICNENVYKMHEIYIMVQANS